MARQNKAHGPVNGVLDTDADGDQCIICGRGVLPYLEGRSRVDKIEAIVGQPRKAKRLTEPTRA